jgi:hypothetical protein
MPSAQQVYMPTDTTQLGFYYQHAPRWLPAPGMIPAAPNPNDWHQPLCNNPGVVVGASAEYSNCPAATVESSSAPTPAAEAPAADAPPAPMADLSAAGEMPSLQPTPR